MEGKILPNGQLMIKRGGDFKNAMCVSHPSNVCADRCRSFNEPEKDVNGITWLEYCQGITRIDVFTDERG